MNTRAFNVKLQKSIGQGEVADLQAYLEQGGDPNWCETARPGLLHHAIAENNIKAVQLLLNKGANPNLKDNHMDGLRPMEYLNKEPLATEIFNLLLSHGLNISYKSEGDDQHLLHYFGNGSISQEMAQKLVALGVEVDVKNYLNQTPLWMACQKGLVDNIQALLEMGANLYAKDTFGRSPLHVMVGRKDMVEDALRLKDARALFRFVPASGDALRSSVIDAINLKKYRDRPKSYHLRTYTSWSELASHLSDIGCPKVARLFERGFDVEHLEALFKAQSAEGEQRVLLGLLEHCKNLEYSTVMMSNCCFVDTFKKFEKDLFFRSVYVAMTRVHDELWLPGDAMGRLSDIARAS